MTEADDLDVFKPMSRADLDDAFDRLRRYFRRVKVIQTVVLAIVFALIFRFGFWALTSRRAQIASGRPPLSDHTLWRLRGSPRIAGASGRGSSVAAADERDAQVTPALPRSPTSQTTPRVSGVGWDGFAVPKTGRRAAQV